MFGPVMISMRRDSSKRTSFGTKASRPACSTTGWRPPSISNIGSSTSCGGALGETRQHIDLRDRGGGRLQRGQASGQMIQQCVVEHLFARQRPIARAQYLVLERFQFGSDEPLGGFDRLAAQVLRRHPVGLTAAHLDVKALHAIEA